MYCDTSLIASVIEKRFSVEEGYGTLFPPRKGGGKADTGLVKALTTYYGDKVIFPLGAQSLPWGRFDEKFLADRANVSSCTHLPECGMAHRVHTTVARFTDRCERSGCTTRAPY